MPKNAISKIFNPRFGTRRLNTDETRVLVSYVREPDRQLSVMKEGRGRTRTAALEDADLQLRPGTWTRLIVSTPSTIYADVTGATVMKSQQQKRAMRTRWGEGATIIVPEPLQVKRATIIEE